jgi:hypothetical protein
MGWQLNLLRGNSDRASTSSRAPLARSTELIIEELDGEVLVYDQATDHAHCLTPTAARVWRACDGYTTVEVLANKLDLDGDTVARALEELETSNLLDTGPTPSQGSTRRELTVRLAKVGGVAAAAPLIYSIVAPTPALAASQSFCLALGCSNVGCGTCHQQGCSCCGPGNAGQSSSKLCTADCSVTNCNGGLVMAHCHVALTSTTCN